jgi:hypothetical protein
MCCYAGRRATRHRPTLRFIRAIRKPKLQIPHLPVEISSPPLISIATPGPVRHIGGPSLPLSSPCPLLALTLSEGLALNLSEGCFSSANSVLSPLFPLPKTKTAQSTLCRHALPVICSLLSVISLLSKPHFPKISLRSSQLQSQLPPFAPFMPSPNQGRFSRFPAHPIHNPQPLSDR